MPQLVVALAIFVGLGAFFLFIHMVMGRFIRPVEPEADKLTIYECGEPTIGSAWVQFDLRYYVVALLFVIFDVEVAFFFPWAIVFGKMNTLAESGLDNDARAAITRQLSPAELPPTPDAPAVESIEPAAARSMAWIAFADILVFFGVLLVGFAYLWKRGDINWVRSVESTMEAAAAVPRPAPHETGELVGAGRP